MPSTRRRRKSTVGRRRSSSRTKATRRATDGGRVRQRRRERTRRQHGRMRGGYLLVPYDGLDIEIDSVPYNVEQRNFPKDIEAVVLVLDPAGPIDMDCASGYIPDAEEGASWDAGKEPSAIPGSFGVVYKGIQKNTGQNVAIKVISGHSTGVRSSDTARIQEEIEQLKRLSDLNHPNILKYYGHELYTTDSGVPAYIGYTKDSSDPPRDSQTVAALIVTEWLSTDLAEMRRKNKDDVAVIMYQLLSGIGCMHENGICHRDLKPENVMLVNKNDLNTIKIIDFGFSKDRDKHGSPRERSTSIVGTYNYASPELIFASDPTDNGSYNCYKNDIWALGIICFELLTGRTVPAVSKTLSLEQILVQYVDQNLGQEIDIAFISNFLCNEQHRWSAYEAIADEWIMSEPRVIELMPKSHIVIPKTGQPGTGEKSTVLGPAGPNTREVVGYETIELPKGKLDKDIFKMRTLDMSGEATGNEYTPAEMLSKVDSQIEEVEGTVGGMPMGWYEFFIKHNGHKTTNREWVLSKLREQQSKLKANKIRWKQSILCKKNSILLEMEKLLRATSGLENISYKLLQVEHAILEKYKHIPLSIEKSMQVRNKSADNLVGRKIAVVNNEITNYKVGEIIASVKKYSKPTHHLIKYDDEKEQEEVYLRKSVTSGIKTTAKEILLTTNPRYFFLIE